MAGLALVMGDGFLTGSILTLVLPLAVLIGVVIWYTVAWSRGMGER